MKIQKVVIKNFRGIEHLELDWTDGAGRALDLVVLGGPNGCGKTSVLEACLYALGGVNDFDGAPRQAVPVGLGNMRDEFWTASNPEPIANVRRGQNKFSIDIVLEHEATNDTIEQQASNITCVSDLRNPILFEFSNEPCAIQYFSARRSQSLIGAVSLATSVREEEKEDARQRTLANLKQELANITAGAVFRHLTATGTVSGEEIDDITGLASINREWKRFHTGGKSNRFDIRPNDHNQWDIYYGFGDNTISIDCLSSGQIELFNFIGWLTLEQARPSILFIDEPEQHLHPEWQHAFVQMLQSLLPQSQIILATHSQEIFSAAFSYQRFWLFPEGDPRIPQAVTTEVSIAGVATAS